MKLSELKINPKNPRIIKDDRFKKLVKSVEEFPKMMKLRPIVIDEQGMVLGGNMRLKVLQHLKFKEIPDEWVKRADELTEEEKQRFIVSDNVGFGDWDWDTLANEWDAVKLEEWGLELFGMQSNEKQEIKDMEIQPYNQLHILISYNIENHNIVMEAINSLFDFEGIEIEKSAN